MRSELYLNNIRVDLKEEISAALTLWIADIRDPKNRNGSLSKTIKLPGTKTLNKLLGGIFDIAEDIQTSGVVNFTPDFNPNLKCTAVYYVDGLQQFDGIMKLNTIERDQADHAQLYYNVNLFGEVANIYSDLGDSKMSSLSFSEYNHTYNKATQKATWTNTNYGTGYVYPMINYGGVVASTWAVEDFKPGVYLKTYVDKIFSSVGRTYTCPFFNSSFFKRLFIPFAGDKLTITATQATARLFSAHTTVDTSGVVSTVDPVIFNAETSDPLNQYNTATGFFTVANSGYYQFYSSGVVTYDAITTVTGTGTSNFFNSSVEVTSGATTNHYPFQQGQLPTFATYTSGQTLYTYTFSGTTQQLLLQAGDTVNVKISPVIGNLTGTIGQKISANSVFFNVVNNAALTDGGPLDMSSALPIDIKQADFLTSVFRLFNMYLEPDKMNPRNLIIDIEADFYGTGVTRDWSKKVDASKTFLVQPMGLLDARRYKLKYADDSDFWNKFYLDKWKESYGEKNLDITNDFLKNTNVNEVIFAPTPSIGSSSHDRIIPEIFQKDSAGLQTSTRSKLRILYWGGAKSTVNSWNYTSNVSGTSVETTYPYSGHIDDPINPTVDLSFGSPREIYYTNPYGVTTYTNNNIYNIYHSRFLGEITDKNSKIVTLYARLRPLDIAQLSFRDKIFIDGHYYRLQKVIDYNPVAETVTKVELLKLKEGVPFTPTVRGLTFTIGETIDGNDFAPTSGGNVGVGDFRNVSQNISVGGSNYISTLASGVIVSGSQNRVGNSSNVSIINSSGVVVLDGLSNVSVVNSNDTVITESNVNYINGEISADAVTVDATITSAQILSFNSTPVTLVTGIPGYIISPVSGWVENNFINGLSTAYNFATTVAVYHNGADAPIMQNANLISATINRKIVLNVFETTADGQTQLIEGADLKIHTPGVDNPQAGDFDIKVHIVYQLVKVDTF